MIDKNYDWEKLNRCEVEYIFKSNNRFLIVYIVKEIYNIQSVAPNKFSFNILTSNFVFKALKMHTTYFTDNDNYSSMIMNK